MGGGGLFLLAGIFFHVHCLQDFIFGGKSPARVFFLSRILIGPLIMYLKSLFRPYWKYCTCSFVVLSLKDRTAGEVYNHAKEMTSVFQKTKPRRFETSSFFTLPQGLFIMIYVLTSTVCGSAWSSESKYHMLRTFSVFLS